MRFLVCASKQQQEELTPFLSRESNEIIFFEKLDGSQNMNSCDAVFLLKEEEFNIDLIPDRLPVFINDVIQSLSELKAPENVIRINGWPGFLQREVWEAAGEITEKVMSVSSALGKKLIKVKDEPGLISATVISMIINEAFFTFKEGVSTKAEIDMAMKLATHYPYGPFEWGEKIGYERVYKLLISLSEIDSRYTPSFNPKSIS